MIRRASPETAAAAAATSAASRATGPRSQAVGTTETGSRSRADSCRRTGRCLANGRACVLPSAENITA